MKLASLEANLGGGRGLLVYPILLFPLFFLSDSLSGRHCDMTEILLTGTLSLNSIKYIKFHRYIDIVSQDVIIDNIYHT